MFTLFVYEYVFVFYNGYNDFVKDDHDAHINIQLPSPSVFNRSEILIKNNIENKHDI